MKKSLTIIKVVEDNYMPTPEDLQEILDKYAGRDIDSVKNEVLAHNIMEEGYQLAHQRFELKPKQLILFIVKGDEYTRSPEVINKLISDFSLVIGETFESEDEHPYLVMNNTVNVEIINLEDFVVVE